MILLTKTLLVVCLPTPLKNMPNRQLGWWHSQTEWKVKKIHGCKPPTRNTSRVILFWPSDGGQNAWQNMHEWDALGFCDKICKAKTMLRHHLCQRKCIGSTYTEQDVHAFFLAVYDLSPKYLWPSRLLGCHMSHGQLLLLRVLSVGNVCKSPMVHTLAHAGTKLVIKKGSTPNVPVVNHMCQEPVLFKRSCTENTPTSCWTRDNFWQFVTCWPWKQGPSRLLGAIMCHLMLWFTLGWNVWDLEIYIDSIHRLPLR